MHCYRRKSWWAVCGYVSGSAKKRVEIREEEIDTSRSFLLEMKGDRETLPSLFWEVEDDFHLLQ